MKWFAFTPAGTILIETASETRDDCIKVLMSTLGAIYPTWADAEARGYEIEDVPGFDGIY